MMDPVEKLLAITHDVKSPLLAIRRLSEGLLDDSESLSEDVRRRLELIHESATEASEQLEAHNISSALSAPDSNESSFEPLDLAAVAEEVVDGFRTYAECKSQTLRSAVSSGGDASDCTVLGDPLQLREAMNNLVSNALKFSPSGSTIEVRVRRSAAGVRFSVTDNGPGLDDWEQDRLFEPMCQLGPDPTDGEESSGVGLYIVRRIAENHEGTVKVESEKGAGSTFRIELPAASASTSPTRPAERSRTEGRAPAMASTSS